MRLTKGDFAVGRTCPTKLYYKKHSYPSLSDDDPYLEFLSDAGYMVERMARVLFPDGRDLGVGCYCSIASSTRRRCSRFGCTGRTSSATSRLGSCQGRCLVTGLCPASHDR